MESRRIRVALVGLGNCASSLIQGLQYYSGSGSQELPGLMQPSIAGYEVRDIQIVAGFDVAAGKVGADISEAIFAKPNNTLKFSEVPLSGVTVDRGPTLDGIGRSLGSAVELSPEPPVDVTALLRAREVDVVVSYLPVGSQKASEFYAEMAIRAGCAFVNCVPVFLASTPEWANRFKTAGLPIIGDDIKSQVGATILHRALTSLCVERGVRLERTYQLNFGGNTDFLNMLDRDRLESKKVSKTRAVTSQLPHDIGAENVHVGPSDYVPWLQDRKFAHIRMEGTGFGGAPISLELKLEVWDSPNSAGVVVDAIRCAKLALDRGQSGPIEAPSSYFMKSPPVQFPDEVARQRTSDFISKA